MPQNFCGKKPSRGSILLLSLFFMTVLFLMAVTMFKLIPTEFHAAHRSKTDLMGHYVANAGVRHAVEWLADSMEQFDTTQDITKMPDYTPDNGVTYPNLTNYNTTQSALSGTQQVGAADWHYDIEIAIQPGTPPTINNFDPRVFTIVSTASHRNTDIRRVEVVVRQASFASFAFYTDQWLGSSKFIIDGRTGITGPVHTNDYYRFDVLSSVWTNPNSKPYFTDQVTHNRKWGSAPTYGDGNEYINSETPYDANGPVTNPLDRYAKIFEGGRGSLRLKDYVQLPSSTASLADRAYGDTTLPSLQGVYVNKDSGNKVKGGILVNGRADAVELRLDQYGNQVTVIAQNEFNVGTKTVTKYKNVPYVPPQYNPPTQYCVSGHWETPPGGGGVSGGQIWVCDVYGYNPPTQKYQQVPDGTTVTNDYRNAKTEIYEVTEANIVVSDGSNNVPAAVGQTVVRSYLKDASGNWQIQGVQVLDGQPNGTIYVQRADVDGNNNVGNRNSEKADIGSVWGITKGSAQTDPNTGQLIRDANNDLVYANKTIATDINADGRIWLTGDLLQFDQGKFDVNPSVGGGALGHPNNWRNVALNPAAVDANGDWKPEVSPGTSHALGLISHDVWMAGSTGTGTSNNSSFNKDGYNDIYAVILAGKTKVDSQGNVIKVNDRPVTSGGFGTERSRRDATTDGLGKYRMIGGIIQGTTGANSNNPSDLNDHVWRTGNMGYDVQLMYDPNASRQGLFPTYPEFSIIRYTERSARS